MPSEVSESERVFQSAAWIWVVYVAILAGIDMVIYANRPILPIVWYHIANILPAVLFLGLSYSKDLKKQSHFYPPLMILIITAAPILIRYLLDLRLPPAPLSNIEGMVLRQLPVLLIGLVLVAWHYNLSTIILYSLVINLLELAIVYGFGLLDEAQLSSFFFIILIRMVCMVVVGIYINRLITRLRIQQESLKSANTQLAHYASTLETLTLSRERNRMSRELHDTAVHTLSGLAVQLETTKAYLDVNPTKAQELVEQSLETTRSGLQETRRVLKALRASPLDDLGLSEAIRELTNSTAERGKLSLDLDLPAGNVILSPDVEQSIYRIAQEAMENVIHHANARQLIVKLEVIDKDIMLLVQDDGIGFNSEANISAGHFGLAGMRERAQLAGGELLVTSQPNHGTSIRVWIKGGYS